MSELEKSGVSTESEARRPTSAEAQPVKVTGGTVSYVNDGTPIKTDRPRDPETGRFIVFDNEHEKYVKGLESKIAFQTSEIDALQGANGNLEHDLQETIILADNLSIEKRELQKRVWDTERSLEKETARCEELFNKWLSLDMRVGDLRMGLSVVIAISICAIAFLTMLVVRK